MNECNTSPQFESAKHGFQAVIAMPAEQRSALAWLPVSSVFVRVEKCSSDSSRRSSSDGEGERGDGGCTQGVYLRTITGWKLHMHMWRTFSVIPAQNEIYKVAAPCRMRMEKVAVL